MSGSDWGLFILFVLLSILVQVFWDLKIYLLTKERDFEASFSGSIAVFLDITAASLIVWLGVTTSTWWIILIYAVLWAMISYIGTIISGRLIKQRNRSRSLKRGYFDFLVWADSLEEESFNRKIR